MSVQKSISNVGVKLQGAYSHSSLNCLWEVSIVFLFETSLLFRSYVKLSRRLLGLF